MNAPDIVGLVVFGSLAVAAWGILSLPAIVVLNETRASRIKTVIAFTAGPPFIGIWILVLLWRETSR